MELENIVNLTISLRDEWYGEGKWSMSRRNWDLDSLKCAQNSFQGGRKMTLKDIPVSLWSGPGGA